MEASSRHPDLGGGGSVRLPERAFSPLRTLAFRVGIALACVAITTFTVYFDREGYSNEPPDAPLTLLDCLYYATVTLSTTGYGDISPVSETARLVNILVLTPLRFLFLIVLVGTTLEALTARTRDDWRTQKWRQKVHDHTLVIGFGVKGRAAVRSLMDNGVPPGRIVVVVNDTEGAAEASRMGLACVVGDARREDVLRDAGIERANRVVVTTDADDTSILVTLTARRLAPNASIVSAARESTNAEILRESGADGVIVTAEAAGRLLSMQLVSPAAGDMMEDLLDTARGLEMVERGITPEELGITRSDIEKGGELVLAVIRDGEVLRFDSKVVKVLQRDDRVVVVRQRPGPRVGPSDEE